MSCTQEGRGGGEGVEGGREGWRCTRLAYTRASTSHIYFSANSYDKGLMRNIYWQGISCNMYHRIL